MQFGLNEADALAKSRNQGATLRMMTDVRLAAGGNVAVEGRLFPHVVLASPNAALSITPHNADGRFGGYPITLKHAFARSINSIAVQLAQQVGIKEIVKYAHLMGIKTPLEEIPALSLGASDVSLLELVNSYCTVVNEGMYHDRSVLSLPTAVGQWERGARCCVGMASFGPL